MAIKIAGTEVISDDKRILNNESLPDIRPSLLLDFANSKTLDPRITFTRGSTATYYDGVTTAKAEENLAKYSQDWTQSAWAGDSAATANQTTAPDGTSTANLLEVSSSGTFKGKYQNISTPPSTVYTASVYVKKSNYDYIRFNLDAQSGNTFVTTITRMDFNLSTGTVIGTPLGTTSITDVGNGWYKLTISGTTPSSGADRIRFWVFFANSSGNPNDTIPSGSELYIWGAQVEQRSSATAYTPTTDSPIVKYQPVLQTAASGEARFDHDPVTGESKGLLIEEARTNLMPSSESTSYGFQYATITGFSIAPDGSNTAIKATPTTFSTADHYIHATTISASTNTTYTMSQFVKKGSYQYHFLRSVFANGNYDLRTVFDLDNGTITDQPNDIDDASITDIGNGWYRVSATYTTPATLPNPSLLFRFHIGATSPYAGNGYDYTLCWGAQVEVGSFPTSYIPTAGSTVTRAAEQANITGDDFSSFFSPQEGTIYASYEKQAIYPIDSRFLLFTDTLNSFSNNVIMLRGNDVPANDQLQITSNGTSIVQYGISNEVFNIQAAACYSLGDFKFSLNGGTAIGGSGGVLPTGINQMNLRADTCGFWFSKIAYYPKRLPNATLQAMTEA